jgi:hypothetical protein
MTTAPDATGGTAAPLPPPVASPISQRTDSGHPIPSERRPAKEPHHSEGSPSASLDSLAQALRDEISGSFEELLEERYL